MQQHVRSVECYLSLCALLLSHTTRTHARSLAVHKLAALPDGLAEQTSLRELYIDQLPRSLSSSS